MFKVLNFSVKKKKKKTQACTQQKQVTFMVKSKGEVRQFPLQLSSL